MTHFTPEPMLRRPQHIPERAKFPVVDAHNHLFGEMPADELIAVMDQVGVRTFLNASGNAVVPFDEKGYVIRRCDFGSFRDDYLKPHPGRFAAFTMSDFALWDDDVLIKDDRFADACIQHLEEDVSKGARGLKIMKELGLRFKDASGAMIPVDDERLSPICKRAGEMGIPVLIHTSDPIAFFLPVDERNEHYPTLKEFPGWSFHGSFYSKWELLEQRNRMIARHPGTTFILAHVANLPEDLDSVAALLDTFPNTNIDFSARIDELGRQPYTARDFMIKYQDRILFGTDTHASVDVYRAYYRFLETKDEYFDVPDYLGRTHGSRWRIYGLHLPDEALRKIYHENADRIIRLPEAA